MANEGGVRNYLNTLIFCIVAKGVTVLLLIALFFEPVQMFAYFVITVEVFLIVIIVLSLISINKYEKQRRTAMENSLQRNVYIQSCPDYYVSKVDQENNIICNNVYDTPDGRFSYEIGHNNPPNIKTIEINNEEYRKKKITYEEKCNSLITDYANIPWTDLKANCHYGM